MSGTIVIGVDVGGTFTNNAENVINVQDPGFLFDLMLRNVNGNLAVELAFQDLSELSDDPNLSVPCPFRSDAGHT